MARRSTQKPGLEFRLHAGNFHARLLFYGIGFELPEKGSAAGEKWRHSHHPNISPWEVAPVVKEATHLAQPRSVVLLALAADPQIEFLTCRFRRVLTAGSSVGPSAREPLIAMTLN
jgi:hypothetical protein